MKLSSHKNILILTVLLQVFSIGISLNPPFYRFLQNSQDAPVEPGANNSGEDVFSFFEDFPKVCPYIPNQKGVKNVQGKNRTTHTWQGKYIKKNPLHELKIGYGPSAIMFDYLDEPLRAPILAEFKRIWQEALAVEPATNLETSFTFMEYYDTQKIKCSESETNSEDVCARYFFDEACGSYYTQTCLEVWKGSLTYAQLKNLLFQWKWDVTHLTEEADPATGILG
ncbi:MAG: hypothetical protein MJ252_15200 [archaeon]|nr:hypothetical protein [archaeon]